MFKVTNQANNQTNQSYKINLNQVYADFITEIDNHRSTINARNRVVDKNTKIEDYDVEFTDEPQESRAHCFYRLIGFPVVAENGEFYNPGIDNTSGVKKISDEQIEKIGANISQKFIELSYKREQYPMQFGKVWRMSGISITPSALALSNTLNLRSFSESVKNKDPFSFNAKDQSYKANFNSIIGTNTKVSLFNYIDGLNQKPDKSLMFEERYHFVFPIMVDPAIDFWCKPASRSISVPFANNKTELLVEEDTYLKRPLIEKIIKDRCQAKASLSAEQQSSNTDKIKNIIESVPSVSDKTIIDRISKGIVNIGEINEFQKYLNIIDAMCVRLTKSQEAIQKAQSNWYYVPTPSINGPEYECTASAPIYGDGSQDISYIFTKNDLDHVNLYVKKLLKESENESKEEEEQKEVVDTGGFAFDAFTGTFTEETSSSFGDMVIESFNTIDKKRTSDMSLANIAMSNIEIIMGEFSGFGLCDIVAIMAALYTMPSNSLIGFLDEDAFDRMKKDPMFGHLEKVSLNQAYKDFTDKLSDFYHLMDEMFKQISKNNGRNSA